MYGGDKYQTLTLDVDDLNKVYIGYYQKENKEGCMSLNKKYTPVVVQSSTGAVLKYTFDTYKELENSFYNQCKFIKKINVKQKVIGKSILVWTNEDKDGSNTPRVGN